MSDRDCPPSDLLDAAFRLDDIAEYLRGLIRVTTAVKPTVTIDADLLDEMERTISIDGQHSDPHVPTYCFICQLLARVKAAREQA